MCTHWDPGNQEVSSDVQEAKNDLEDVTVNDTAEEVNMTNTEDNQDSNGIKPQDKDTKNFDKVKTNFILPFNTIWHFPSCMRSLQMLIIKWRISSLDTGKYQVLIYVDIKSRYK